MSCSACGSKGRMTFSQIVIADKSSLPTLKYLHCKYQDQFESLFKQATGMDINEANLKALAYLHDSGGDKSGKLTDINGKPIIFSVEDTLKMIDTSKISNNLCAV